ncbi:PepSY domain-containing protein [Frigoribacterium sp. Leaf186]|uniref:PepSY domain-containing protein n=1 Tax=Frigoribacterium sp. Leaf186 TaxID=1736293 RepID=UPI0006FFF3B1|nr:PepSY domain-containing protein [Frigoribacterium sp. Leaf186]KQS16255.1 hypothetical protein ASG05_10720 [Frigoribacterium sp. Leaf186]
MLKNALTTKKSLLIAGGIAGVLVLGGGGVAVASGLDDDRVSTQTRDRAQEAALAETGGGTVTEVDTLDDGLVGYEVEVVLPDGREAKVLLDGDYGVTSSRVDDDSSRSVTTPAHGSDDGSSSDDDSSGPSATPTPVVGDDSAGSTPTPVAVDDAFGSAATPTPVADDHGRDHDDDDDDHGRDDDH